MVPKWILVATPGRFLLLLTAYLFLVFDWINTLGELLLYLNYEYLFYYNDITLH